MVHKYSIDDTNIVIDVNSGSVHIVEPPVFDILDYYETKTENEIVEILKDKHGEKSLCEGLGEIKELVENEMLFSKDIYKEIAADMGKNRQNPVIKALCLLIAQDCNMKCGYCFADEYASKRALMSTETGKKAVDFLLKNSGSRKNLEVDFFGGEPLLNFDVVKEIVAYARGKEAEIGKHIRFTLTTNGILLDDDKLEFINREMKNVVLSIDGRREVNDNMRQTLGGNGTYDTIVPKFLKTAESRNQENYYVRGTFTKYNLDFSNDALHLADLGFKQVSVEPVVCSNGMPYGLKKDDLPVVFGEYEKLAEELISRENREGDFNFFHYMIDLEGGPCVYKRIAGCGAGTEYLCVAANGELYPCHQFTGIERFKMGSVELGVSNNELREEFLGCNVYTKEKCRDCFAKFYCGGGCAANAYNENGTIDEPYEIGCEMQKKRTECAIYVKAKRS